VSFIILDRDGVINFESDEYIKSPAEWHPIPGSLEAIAALNRAGFHVFIATNQSGVARGLYDIATLHAIHEKLICELAKVGGYVDEIFFCPHHPDENCLCRKPKPGLLWQIQEKYPLQFSETFYIGDSLKDIQVAQEVGCKPLLVLTGNGLQTHAKYAESLTVPTFPDLAHAVAYVLAEE
jgi:D-glycero-D-manno-heptose 1,7-bisphosphate phosphatase